MDGRQDLVLMLEEYDHSFSIRLLDRSGFVFSDNRFKGIPAIGEVRVLVSTLTHIFGNFNRVTYSRDFQCMWDHEARPDAFGKFMAELFASHNPDDWDGFSRFLEEQEAKTREDPLEGLPF
jgi:hypothetical protein